MEAFDLLPGTVFETDSNGIISYVNKVGCEALGYENEELRGMTVFDLVRPEWREAAMKRFHQKRAGKLAEPSSYTITRKDGSEFPVLVYSSPVVLPDGTTGLRGIMADVTVQEKGKERLREDGERFRTLLQTTRDGIFFKDASLTYLDVNPVMANLAGIPAEQFIGSSDRRLFDEATACRTEDDDRRVLRGETIEKENSAPLGERAPTTRIVKAPVRNSKGRITGICGIIQDITERRNAEKVIREAEERYHTVIQNMNDGVAVISGDRHIFVNQRFLDMLGCSMESLTNSDPFAWVHPDDRDMVRQRNRLRQQGLDVPARYRFKGVRTDGTVIIVEVSVTGTVFQGKPATFAFLRDVTEMELAAQNLEAERRRLFDIIDFLPDATFIIDNDKKVVAWNRAMEAMTGTRKCDILGKGDFAYAEAFYGEKRPLLIDAVQGDCSGIEDRYTFIRSSGNGIYAETIMQMPGRAVPRYLWGSAALLLDADGNRIGAVESIRDVTEHKRLEAEYLHSQKMEMVGNLAAGIAHDFNNVLSVIIGYSSLLQAKLGPDNPHQVYTEEIMTAAGRASHLTHSLLAFSRRQIMNMKPLEINMVLRESRKLLSRLLPEDIEFAVIPADDDMVIMADRVQIEQVLMNLVSNARDAISTKGKVMIRVVRVSGSEEKKGEYVLISCTDNGCGMDAHTRERIFEPFFTRKEVGKGTGLGLPMVLGIVEQHEGYVHVESEPGKGSVFSVYIPLIKKQLHSPGNKEVPRAVGGKETILLAEDDPSVRAFAHDVLEEYGYTVFETANGEQAVERFMENRDTVDLLFLDVVMPLRNGREVYDAARILKPDIKVLFYSGHTEDVILRRGLSVGQFCLLKKPVSPEDILIAVRSVLDERRPEA